MDTERIERAQRHAALSDVSRLHLLDLLALGDRSSTELQLELAISSNLLAHHLRVLDEAGLVHRHRSEADRRRSYVGLAPAALEFTRARAAASRVVFVCTANSARSQLASLLWASTSPVPSTSAGTHPADRIAPGAAAVARAHGLDVGNASPRSLAGLIQPGDFVITVCDNAREGLPSDPDAHWSVPDPVRAGTRESFEAAFTDIQRRVLELAPRISAA